MRVKKGDSVVMSGLVSAVGLRAVAVQAWVRQKGVTASIIFQIIWTIRELSNHGLIVNKLK